MCAAPCVSSVVPKGRRQAIQHESSLSELTRISELTFSGILIALDEEVIDLISSVVASRTTATSENGMTGKRW